MPQEAEEFSKTKSCQELKLNTWRKSSCKDEKAEVSNTCSSFVSLEPLYPPNKYN